MKKILITGGLGNLGSWLTRHFASQGYEVTVLSKNFRKLLTTAKYTLIQADITDFAQLKIKLDGYTPDIIIHAGSVNDGFVPEYYKLAIEVNTLGSRNMLEWAKNIPNVHFIYLSTFQVYGKYSGFIAEDTPTEPINDYGSSHLFAEILVKQMGKSNGLKYTILRLTNSYGCPLDVHTSKWYLVLNDLSKTAIKEKKIVLKSNGLAPRDMIWMGTVCAVFQKLVEKNATLDTYNLSGQNTLKMLDVAYAVQRAYATAYGKEIPVLLNAEDKTQYPEDLKVSAMKLQSFISFEAPNKLQEEATEIFKLIETHNI